MDYFTALAMGGISLYTYIYVFMNCVVLIVQCHSNGLNLISGLTWLMVYRTEKYQKLKAEVERQSKRCKCVCEM